jgi:hypothetical protein
MPAQGFLLWMCLPDAGWYFMILFDNLNHNLSIVELVHPSFSCLSLAQNEHRHHLLQNATRNPAPVPSECVESKWRLSKSEWAACGDAIAPQECCARWATKLRFVHSRSWQSINTPTAINSSTAQFGITMGMWKAVFLLQRCTSVWMHDICIYMYAYTCI